MMTNDPNDGDVAYTIEGQPDGSLLIRCAPEDAETLRQAFE
jgi:hypothetical protein